MSSLLTGALRAAVRCTEVPPLERLLASGPALGVAFGAMARRFDPDASGGFDGELQFDLRRPDGSVVPWTIEVRGGVAEARPGPAGAPALIATATMPDALRIATGELEAGRAILDARLELAGDFRVAMRLGQMFGGADHGL